MTVCLLLELQMLPSLTILGRSASAGRMAMAVSMKCCRVPHGLTTELDQGGGGKQRSQKRTKKWSMASYPGAICMLVAAVLLLSMVASTLVVLQSYTSPQWMQQLLLAPPEESSRAGQVRGSRDPATDVEWLIRQEEKNGTDRCDEESTSRVALVGRPELQRSGMPLLLEAGVLHELLMVSYTENRTRRCAGGDFYETALTGVAWRSRPPVLDLGDGSYLVRLQVPERVTGVLRFRAVLLFGNLHGLDLQPDSWIQDKEVLGFDVEFVAASRRQEPPEDLQLCRGTDFFKVREWKGQWSRTTFNASCNRQPEADGRFRCLDPSTPCDPSWCDGAAGRIESNGWVYSAHCKFRIFDPAAAWKCASSLKWIFFWGDSNHQDTIRNLLNFILGLNVGWVSRTIDDTFHNPANMSQSLRITSIFGGHYDDSKNDMGLASLSHGPYREFIQSYFNNSQVPSFMVLNSGLHDGTSKKWSHLTKYVKAAESAASFWAQVWDRAGEHNKVRPRVVLRTTVAPAGQSRHMTANPHKMEVYNKLLLDRFLATGIPLQVVDAYDLTFPWHFDNNCSDGGHYGRPPALQPWFGQIGHQYFVDIMLAHILLNVACPQ